MVIQTNRLLLREAVKSDRSFFFSLMNTPKWIQFIGDRKIKTVEDAENYINNSLIKSYQSNGFGLYIMEFKSDSTPIGICGLVKRRTLAYPDLGFAILPDYEKKGYAYEASMAVIDTVRSKLNMNLLLGITSADNEASIELLKKLDFSNQKEIEMDSEALLCFELKLNT